MALQIVPKFEREVRGLITVHVEGKDLARAVELHPEWLASLMKFSSITAAQLDELREMEDEWQEMTDEPFPRVEWFDAAQGGEAVQQVLGDVEAELAALDEAEQDAEILTYVIEDLHQIAQNLQMAAKFGVRFHLAGEF